MSMGFFGHAHLAQSDDSLVIYTYCCYNANNEDYKAFMNLDDGELYIDREAFIEPEIHEKTRKTPSGKKKTIIKRIPRDIPMGELIAEGKIKVTNASGTWKTTETGIDIMALRLMNKIFQEYQLTGAIPQHISWIS